MRPSKSFGAIGKTARTGKVLHDLSDESPPADDQV
jgi:hypothetical protein